MKWQERFDLISADTTGAGKKLGQSVTNFSEFSCSDVTEVLSNQALIAINKTELEVQCK